MELFAPLGLDWILFSMLGKFSTIISSKIFSYPVFSSSSFGTPIIQMLAHIILNQRSLRLSSVLFILFSLFCSSAIISTILSSSSLICFSASGFLLLITSRVFFFFFLISGIVLFVSVCLFLTFLGLFKFILSFSSFYFQGFWSSFLSLFFRKFSGSLFLFIYLNFCVSSLFLQFCSISLPFHYF